PAYHLTARRRRRRAQRWAAGVVGYAASLLLIFASLRLISGGAQGAVADQLAAAETRITDTQAALDHIQPRLAAALASLEAGNSVGDQPDWSILLRVVADLLGDDAVLTRFTLEPVHPSSNAAATGRVARRYVVHVHGLGRSHEQVAAFVLAMEQLELFDAVKL